MDVWQKLRLFILAGIVTLTFSSCGGGSASVSTASSPSTPATQNEWTWVGGSNNANEAGTYGTLGMASANNTPAGRDGAVSWTDASGNLWLFGGEAAPSSLSDNFFNDLWKYSSGQWTWMGGANTTNQAGVYGTQGVAASTNIPGARTNAVSWTDTAGNFWLFGGIGLDANGRSELLNDLWKYNAGQWTWMGGSDIGIQNQPGVYGMQGVASPANIPGMRVVATSWTDVAGNLWLFGGSGYDSNGTLGNLNDLWKYSGGEWTWMGGSNLANQPGTYGIEGMASPNNSPGARIEAVGWIDTDGNFWLFGGSSGQVSGPSGPATFAPMNDLWRYSAGQWTWMSGSNIPNQLGNYGTQGIAAVSNTPGARVLATTWTDASGNLWLFGGNGYDSNRGGEELNDLWRYSGGQWTWIAGPNAAGHQGIYGSLGSPTPSSIPGGRSSAIGWTDATGNFLIFGGNGFDSIGTLGYLNDVWMYGLSK